MRTIITLALGFLLASPVLAAPARPASRPATQAELEAKIADLTRRLDELTRMVESLREAIAGSVPAKPTAPNNVADALKAGKLAIGMTVEQVEQVTKGGVGGKGELMSKSGNTATYRWQISNTLDVIGDRRTGKIGSYLITCRFESGLLDSFTIRELSGTQN